MENTRHLLLLESKELSKDTLTAAPVSSLPLHFHDNIVDLPTWSEKGEVSNITVSSV